MKVIWTPEAQKDREDIWEFIANENPFAATKMDELFSEAAARLSEHSMLGKAGQRYLVPARFSHTRATARCMRLAATSYGY